MPSRKCARTRSVVLGCSGGLGEMNSSAPITHRNEIALAANAHDGPSVASTSPAIAGPNARAAVNCIEFTRTALSNAFRGTSCGTNAIHADVVTPVPSAEITTKTRMLAVVAVPVAHVIHNAAAIAIITTCAQIRTRRRSCRSLSEPASGLTTVAGKNARNALSPTSAVECVSWSMTNGTVTVCIHVPVFESSPAVKNTENSRDLNAASGPTGASGTSGLLDSVASSPTAANATRALGVEHVFVYDGARASPPTIALRDR